MKKSISFIFLLLSAFVMANENKQVWDARPEFSAVLPEYTDEKVVGIFMKEDYEYIYSEEGDFQCIQTIHKKFRLNTDNAINNFNKISVSLADVVELIDLKARVIKPDGKVVDFDEKNIKEVQDEESGNSMKIFAIDGIIKGDDIEYYVIKKVNASSFSRSFFQFSFPVQSASFSLTAPQNILFAIKGYNGFPSPTYIKLEDERNYYECSLDKIKLLKDEKVAYYDPRRARLEWKIDYNFKRGNAPLLTWDDAAKNVYEATYLNLDEKSLTKWIDAIGVHPGSEKEMAAQVEKYIKDNIFIQEYEMPEFYDKNYVLENKVTNANGVVRIYAALFKKLGIDHRLVITSPRDKVKFDKDFQSWNYLDLYLIYLPKSDIYIDPNNSAFRLGCVDGNLTATDGLVISPVRFGGFESAIAKTKYIEPTSHEVNYDHLHIKIDIDVDEGMSRVQTTRGFNGLSGGYIGNIYKVAEEEYKQNILTSVMPTKAAYSDYTTLEVRTGSDVDYLANADFIIFSDLTSHDFLQEAGEKILVNIGETIGQQVEMYFEDDRNIGVENNFNRSYYREISLTIPEGYKISNPEAADMNIVEEIEGNKQYGFESEHSLENNIYKIVIDEYYKQIYAGIEHFEGYKNVVNAAADFNKVVLVLEKE